MASSSITDLDSPYYKWRDNRKIKYFVFTVTTATEKETADVFVKRCLENEDDGIFEDVDLRFLKAKFLKVPDLKDLKVYLNLNHDKLFAELANLQLDESLKEYDCFFFIFLTYMFGTEKQNFDESLHFLHSKVPLEKIYEEIDKIQPMLLKPKIFLVQADDVKLLAPDLYVKAKGMQPRKEVIVPHDADRITILSTVPGRHFVTGNNASFLIQAFVDAMDENSTATDKLDFLSLTTIINGKVEKMIEDWKAANRHLDIELPSNLVTSTLRKLLIFE